MWKHVNGNVTVTIQENGETSLDFDGEPILEYPLQVDIKLTESCALNCDVCHEKHSVIGRSADLNELKTTLSELPSGTTLVLLGGDIFTLGNRLVSFLAWCQSKEFIVSVKVHYSLIDTYSKFINGLINNKLIYGIGVLMPVDYPIENGLDIFKNYPHLVLYSMCGIHSIDTILSWSKSGYNHIVLTYSDHEKFLKHYPKKISERIASNLLDLKRNMYKLFAKGIIIDESSVEILEIDRFFTEEGFKELYKENKMIYSIYLDAVNNLCYASDKLDQKGSLKEISLINYFQTIKTTI